MANEPIEVESTCEECGQPSGIFPVCKSCDYAWLTRMRKESERG